MPSQQQHWTTHLHLALLCETSLFLRDLTYTELTSIKWKQSPWQEWNFNPNMLSDARQAHPAPTKLAVSLHIAQVLLIHNLHVQGPVGGTFYCSLCVLDRTAAVLSHKKRRKGIQRQFRVNSIPSCRFHCISLVPLVITTVLFIAEDTWICSKYNNELLYNNYIETMVGKQATKMPQVKMKSRTLVRQNWKKILGYKILLPWVSMTIWALFK